VTDEWELITFDMTPAIGNSFNRLVFFPDFPDTRESGSLCYIDNIGFVPGVSVPTKSRQGITLYPNPAADRITLQYPDMESVTISNVLGQSVRNVVFYHSDLEVIDVSDLDPGLYFVTLETAGSVVSTKFIRE
jgi:hypothetical protein